MTYDNFESYANAKSNERKRFNPRIVTISAIDDLYRENQFLKRKVNSKDVLIRNLEYDYAVLQRKKTERKEFLFLNVSRFYHHRQYILHLKI